MPARALVLVCSDDGYPFNTFLERELGLVEGYRLIIQVPGGAAPLVHEYEAPVCHEALMVYLKTVMPRKSSIDTAVVIGHENCLFYKERLKSDAERSDLPAIKSTLKQLFPQLRHVRLYFAVPDSGKVNFHRVDETSAALQPT